MKIEPSEIASVETIGILDGNKVSLIKTKGGLHVASGRKKGSINEEVLSAGSHGAIVKFNLENQYPGFQPIMAKNELSINKTTVNNHSKCLSDGLKKSGHDIYSIQTNNNIEFQITKHDIKIGNIKAQLENGEMVINKIHIPKELAHALAGATTEKALSLGTSKVVIKG